MRILVVLLVLLCSATGSKGMGLICDDKNVASMYESVRRGIAVSILFG